MTTSALDTTIQEQAQGVAGEAGGSSDYANAANAQLKRWQPDEKDIEDAARICHDANRAICTINGDFSQPTWEDAPEWQKASAMDGVRFHIDNRHADGRQSHDRWMEVKLRDGWRYGPTKDAATKEHPCLLPYHALPQHERVKDDVFRAIVSGYFSGKR